MRAQSFIARLILFAALFEIIDNWTVIVRHLEIQAGADYPEYLHVF